MIRIHDALLKVFIIFFHLNLLCILTFFRVIKIWHQVLKSVMSNCTFSHLTFLLRPTYVPIYALWHVSNISVAMVVVLDDSPSLKHSSADPVRSKKHNQASTMWKSWIIVELQLFQPSKQNHTRSSDRKRLSDGAVHRHCLVFQGTTGVIFNNAAYIMFQH